MPTRLVSVVVDARNMRAQADFWATLLGWTFGYADDDEADVEPPDGDPLELVFVQVAEPKTTKNRVHLDLASTSPEDQAAIVARAEGMGAHRVDIGQGDVPWVVMADPEGNEFCVLEPRATYDGVGSLAAVVVDTTDVAASTAFWRAAGGWDALRDEQSLRHPSGRGPWLEFLPAGPKSVKNRVHLDVAPYADDPQAAEVERLLAAGATRVDVGQGDVPWAVMADPQGNEFCVLSSR